MGILEIIDGIYRPLICLLLIGILYVLALPIRAAKYAIDNTVDGLGQAIAWLQNQAVR